MDLISPLRRWALARPRVLLVDAPGSRDLRWAVEAELGRRVWPLAVSPADTDLLLVLGAPGPELAAAAEVLWTQVPQPRHRAAVDGPEHLGHRLDAAAEALLAAASAPEETVDGASLLQGRSAAGTEADSDMGGHEGHDMAGQDEHAGHDMGGQDEHAGHDMGGHGGHHMHHGGEVAGLAMADTAPDRDGLQLDALGISLGPVLPDWPTGLVLRARLQGDVLSDVRLSWADEDDRLVLEEPVTDARVVALDHLARFLGVAGWTTAARDARRARDGLRSTDPATVVAASRTAQRLARMVSSSRTLGWSVQGMGSLSISADGPIDVLERVHRWCSTAAGEAGVPAAPLPLDLLAAALEGAELAAARLVVASVEVARAPVDTLSGWTHA